jgi:hypothetical protein
MKQYSIMGRVAGGNHLVEVCQVDQNPEAIAESLRAKRRMVDLGTRRVPQSVYEHVEVRENLTAATPPR